MIELALVGIGTGDPAHLTPAAAATLAAADLVLIPLKGTEKADLADIRRRLCAAILPPTTTIVTFDLPRREPDSPYIDGVLDWHDAIAATWSDLLAHHLPHGGRAALMIWGDPSLYDSSLRIAERLQTAGVPLTLTVIPGLTSLQLLAAAHAIPLNTLGDPFLVTTGRRLAADGWPGGVDTVAVMLDGACAFRTLPPENLAIWWGAYLGMPQQILHAGPLATAGPDIVARRAAARTAHGWIMDTYLLRRSPR